MEEEFCDLLGTVDSTGKGSLCYNGECWAVSLVRHCEPILETLTVTHRYLRRERHPIFPYVYTPTPETNAKCAVFFFCPRPDCGSYVTCLDFFMRNPALSAKKIKPFLNLVALVEFDHLRVQICTEVRVGVFALKGVVNCQNSRDKGPPEGNGVRG